MIGHDVVLVLMGVAVGVLASLATGLAVRVALGGRTIVASQVADGAGAGPAQADTEQEIAIALAAVAGFAKSR